MTFKASAHCDSRRYKCICCASLRFPQGVLPQSISAARCDAASMKAACDAVSAVTAEAEPGKIYEGTVTGIKEFGAFIEFAPGKEGMVHISKIARERINRVEDVLTLGDTVTVICLGKDRMGRISFSMKDVAQR